MAELPHVERRWALVYVGTDRNGPYVSVNVYGCEEDAWFAFADELNDRGDGGWPNEESTPLALPGTFEVGTENDLITYDDDDGYNLRVQLVPYRPRGSR